MFENVPPMTARSFLIGIAKSLHFRADRLASLARVAFPIIPPLIPWQASLR